MRHYFTPRSSLAIAATLMLSLSPVAPVFAQAAAPAVTATSTRFIANQASGEIRASNLIGVVVTNKKGEAVGDIADVVLMPTGQVTSVVVGVGGVLGLGEKNVAIPFDAIAITTDKDGKRSATLDVDKAALQAAPTYVSERTTFEKVQDGVSVLATSAKKKAIELKDQMTTPKSSTDAPK